jgi:hypothetical protein
MRPFAVIPRRWAGLLTRAVLLAVLVLFSARPPAWADTSTVVRCRLETPEVNAGGTVRLYIEIQDVSNFYGHQMDVHFDPARVDALDGAPGPSGVNFALGAFISPDFVVRNNISNTTGLGQLALTAVSPSLPQTGSGELAHVDLLGQTYGVFDITLDNVILSTPQGQAIPYTVQNCTLNVKAPFSYYLPVVLK